MKKVLIVDDQALVRHTLRKILEQAGYAVRDAEDGLKALALIKEDKPDLILLDRHLPGMTGSQVLREIRRHAPEVKVVVLTGYQAAEGEAKYRALGVKSFLSKDIDMDALLTVIATELGQAVQT